MSENNQKKQEVTDETAEVTEAVEIASAQAAEATEAIEANEVTEAEDGGEALYDEPITNTEVAAEAASMKQRHSTLQKARTAM